MGSGVAAVWSRTVARAEGGAEGPAGPRAHPAVEDLAKAHSRGQGSDGTHARWNGGSAVEEGWRSRAPMEDAMVSLRSYWDAFMLERGPVNGKCLRS